MSEGAGGSENGGDGMMEPRSERVPMATHPDWELEPCGAARRDESVFVLVAGPHDVRVMWRDGGTTRSQLVPSVVLEHVLRMQRCEMVEAG